MLCKYYSVCTPSNSSFKKKTKIFSNERVSFKREISLEAVRQTNLESINGNRLLENMSKTIP